jgi:hypothetical protein
MGNHVVGKAMGLAAEEAIRGRRPGEAPLAILDRICGPYRGADAEFEAEDPAMQGFVHPEFADYTDPHPKAALGMLMLEAFAPNGTSDLVRYAPMLCTGPGEEAACDAWWEEVYEPFNKRFNFC